MSVPSPWLTRSRSHAAPGQMPPMRPTRGTARAAGEGVTSNAGPASSQGASPRQIASGARPATTKTLGPSLKPASGSSCAKTRLNGLGAPSGGAADTDADGGATAVALEGKAAG